MLPAFGPLSFNPDSFHSSSTLNLPPSFSFHHQFFFFHHQVSNSLVQVGFIFQLHNSLLISPATPSHSFLGNHFNLFKNNYSKSRT